jgi:hypothetical protein
MNCREVRKWMSPYLDSELGQTKTFEVSEHLRTCARCAARFEAERGVDERMRERLAEPAESLPADVWSHVTRDITTPAWLRRLHQARAQLAVAACVIVVLVGAALVWLPVPRNRPPWVVAQLAVEAPGHRPFVGSVAGSVAAVRMLRNGFGLQLRMEPLVVGPQQHYDLQLIGAAPRSDGHGREFLEVRLNCCGKPVMLLLARLGGGELPEPFDAAPLGGNGLASRLDDLNIATMQTDTFVALAASPHPVGDILDRLTAV